MYRDSEGWVDEEETPGVLLGVEERQPPNCSEWLKRCGRSNFLKRLPVNSLSFLGHPFPTEGPFAFNYRGFLEIL
jgi:hypothetical protein